MNPIIALRHQLHRNPELSGAEYKTAKRLKAYLNPEDYSEIISLGETGFAVVYDSRKEGPATVLRAELDALPIVEKNNLEYASAFKGVGHLCGHDGHMAILVGLVERLKEQPPQKGKVVVLFQPAEETGQGAYAIINHPGFRKIAPDYIFALHNVPGFKMHEVLIRDEAFSAASKGMTIHLHGRTSHAAEPENGISPAGAVAAIIQAFEKITRDGLEQYEEKMLITVIQAQLGEIAFGTTPGYAEVRATLRTTTNEGLEALNKEAEQVVRDIAATNQLRTEISYCEYFPATVNDPECNEVIREAAVENQCVIHELDFPFKWSEDFGFYTQKYVGSLFGLGSGKDQPPLHHPGFDFPDELIETGIQLFEKIIKKINY